MNQYEKRLNDLEKRKAERMKTPVIIAALTAAGEYEYKGSTYNEEQFQKIVKKARPNTVIIDDTKAAGTL